MNIRSINRDAWNRQVEAGNRWTVPVDGETIARARQGKWSLLLTPCRPVPRAWFPAELSGLAVLCLASGGGQQAPTLAAAGARVTILDNSPKQLEQDRLVAEREGLQLVTVEGDMADLAMFESESFDLIFHPCSNSFVPEVRPVWREAFRVLRGGGALLAGFSNPLRYLFDEQLEAQGQLVVRHAIPYSDLTSLTDDEKSQIMSTRPLQFGHTLEDQLAGQLEAGFVIAGMYEDRFGTADADPISQYIASFLATRAVKLPNTIY